MIYGKKTLEQLEAEDEKGGEQLVTYARGDDGEDSGPFPKPEEEEEDAGVPEELLDRMLAMIKAGRTPEEIGEAVGNRDLAINYFMHFMSATYDEAGTVCERCGGLDKVETCRCLWAAPFKSPGEKSVTVDENTPFYRFETWHGLCGKCLFTIKSQRGAAQAGAGLLAVLAFIGGLFFIPFFFISIALAVEKEWEPSIYISTVVAGLLLAAIIWGIIKLRRAGTPRGFEDIGRKPFFLGDIV